MEWHKSAPLALRVVCGSKFQEVLGHSSVRLVPQHSCWERLGEHGIQGTHCPCGCFCGPVCLLPAEGTSFLTHVSDLTLALRCIFSTSYGSDVSLKLHLIYSRSLEHPEPSFSESTVD